eukprot:TRINITY_DN72542_c0_g1_i1.p1 TRINITY_DN72542_c0_g1~~TRINITY_DN72542_c0_g1_i1.p1  ORF type:complete len:437 (+),score=75.20 TRINITY_DN72542_c0_g1_i1:183-1493(+)
MPQSGERRRPQSAERRRAWVENEAVPALRQTALLAGCPEEFLYALAEELQEKSHAPGERIVTVGDETAAMIVLLSGTVDLEAKTGDRVGQLARGGSCGEVAALGLFPASMGTLRATSLCRTMAVTEAALRKVLDQPGREDMALGLRKLVETRHEQVREGLPLTALEDVGARAEDVSVRAISLCAERIHLGAGEVWLPVADGDPSGPCVSVLVRGRGAVEMSADRIVATQLFPGALILEGLLAGCNARFRAETECEAYRIRKNDFHLAVASANSPEWVWRFKLREKDSGDHLRMRLGSICGLLESGAPSERDQEIQAFVAHRRYCVNRAWKRRHGEPEEPRALPSMPSGVLGGGRSLDAEGSIGPGRSLNAYSVLRLPDLLQRGSGSAGSSLVLRGGGSSASLGSGSGVSRSHSESALRRAPGAPGAMPARSVAQCR